MVKQKVLSLKACCRTNLELAAQIINKLAIVPRPYGNLYLLVGLRTTQNINTISCLHLYIILTLMHFQAIPNDKGTTCLFYWDFIP